MRYDEDDLLKDERRGRLRRGEDDEEMPRRRREVPMVHPGRQLMHLLSDFEERCKQATLAEQAIRAHLEQHEDVKLMWEDFQKRGGSTSGELAMWLLDDDWVRKDMSLRKKHLRLVASRDVVMRKKTKRVRLRDDNGPEAA